MSLFWQIHLCRHDGFENILQPLPLAVDNRLIQEGLQCLHHLQVFVVEFSGKSLFRDRFFGGFVGLFHSFVE